MGAYYAATIMQVLTEAVKKAGTVDDVDKIIAVLETETFDTMAGPLKYGGEGLDGVGHMLLWPATVAEIRDHSYHVIAEFTPEEAEALAVEAYE
jgi:ABC-type branched-subunit amino acid transport system substrate-binding protein